MLDLYKITRTSLSTARRVVLAQLRGAGATGDDDNAEPFDDAELMFPLGMLARPLLSDGTHGIGFNDGVHISILTVIDKTLGVISALEEGETRIFGAAIVDSFLQILANGNVRLKAKTGQTITIEGDNATVVIGAAGQIVVTPKAGQFAIIGGTSGAQAMLMGDAITSTLNELRSAVNACRADLNTVKTHDHPETGTTTSASTELTGLPTASVVGAIPAQSTKAKNA